MTRGLPSGRATTCCDAPVAVKSDGTGAQTLLTWNTTTELRVPLTHGDLLEFPVDKSLQAWLTFASGGST